MIPEQVIADIQGASHIVLFTHTHPDGDALGSTFGLASVLDSLGKNVFCYLEEPVSHLYKFLPESNRASTSLEEYRNFVRTAGEGVLAIALDCGDADRLGRDRDEFLATRPFVVIDHHSSHCDFGTSRWVDVASSSTGEMVYELAIALGVSISYNCALNLYVALCTDTGSFRYECTRARTMGIAGELLEKGVRPEKIGVHLYDNFSLERLKLLELALATISLCDEGRIAFMTVSRELLEQTGASQQDLEGFIDFPRSLKSVRVAVLFKQTTDATAVSLRAKGDCDVAEVAKRFGGGGHRNAAGFRSLGRTPEQLQHELEQVLKSAIEDGSTDRPSL